MERSTKRQKLDHNTEPDLEPRSGTPCGFHPNSSQQSNRFDGQGIQNAGHLAVARDINIVHHSHAVDKEQQDRERREEHRRALLESLRFPQMDARHVSIKKAHAKTCRWFLKDPEYLQWLKNGMHNQGSFLWIKGKPGAGKSVMMKFLLDQTRRVKKEGALVSFFFNARGSDMEKTTLGLYRSLLVQLFVLRPCLQSILDRFSQDHYQWSMELLKELLQEAIENFNEAQIVCFIDALDECQEQEVRDMILYLSELCDAGNRLHICFASRHYPHITITKGRSIILQDKEQHCQDIASYIDSAIRIGADKLVEEIKSGLQEKASGVFMWVVLVVDILNKEYDAGQRHRLRARLRQIPGDLHTLFRDILTRDKNKKPELLLCIQWVLFARQPLSPRQLYFAILSGLEPENLPECHSDEIKDDDVAKFVLDSSKGLAESTKSKLPTIQFIHESVRDFLLKDNGLQVIWPDAGMNVEGKSHEALKQACFAYMSSEPVTCLGDSFPKRKASSAEKNQKRESINSQVPFLEYANQSILFHANRAATYSYSQADFLASFPLAEWVAHHNLFQRHQIRYYTPAVSLRYVLAEGNHGALLRAQPVSQSCFNVEKERYGTALFAALAMKSMNAVQALIEGQQLVEMANPSLGNVPIQTSDYEDWCDAFGRTFSFSTQKGVVSHLVEAGYEKLLQIFCANEQFNARSKDKRGWLPLSYAADKGHIDVARLLLERDANVNAADPSGWTPLIRALSGGHVDVAKLLVERGANVNTADSSKQTPLICALGGSSTVDSFTSGGLNANINFDEDIYTLINTIGPIRQTPCSWASSRGIDVTRLSDVVRFLVERGADVNAASFSGQTPLICASSGGHIDVAKLLVKRGANVNIADSSKQTPLICASSGGHIDVAKLLVKRGANINTADSFKQTPLAQALSGGHIDVAKFLIEQGAHVNATDSSKQTPLTWASSGGHIDVAKLLVERGANVNAADSSKQTPLIWASSRGYLDMAKLLIERGADSNAADSSKRTPLTWASIRGYIDVVKFLIEQGADVNAADSSKQTPLTWASSRGHIDVAKLLVERGAEIPPTG